MFKRFSNTRARAPCNPRRGAVFAPKWAKKFCKPALRQLAKFRVHSRSIAIKNRVLVSFSALSRLFALIRPTPFAFYHSSRKLTAVNMIPFHSIRENLKYGHSPISWDMLYNIVMFVPFGIIYCYYQKTFCIYKAIGLSVLTTFSIEIAQFILKTGVVDIDDLIVNTIGSLVGIFFYIALQKILQRAQMLDVHEVIDTVATILPPLFITFVVEMFFGDGSPKLLFIHNIVLISYGIFDYTFLINDFSWKSKLFYAAFYVGIFWLLLAIL